MCLIDMVSQAFLNVKKLRDKGDVLMDTDEPSKINREYDLKLDGKSKIKFLKPKQIAYTTIFGD
jgi:hypothetical protein